MSSRPSVDAAKLAAVRARLHALKKGAKPGKREAAKLDELVARMAKGKRAEKRRKNKANKKSREMVLFGKAPPPQTRRVPEIMGVGQAVSRTKRLREDDNDIPFGSQKRRVTPGGVGFITKSGKVVTFQKTGARKRALHHKIVSGQAKCMVDPTTGRAVREGSRKYKKMAKFEKAELKRFGPVPKGRPVEGKKYVPR